MTFEEIEKRMLKKHGLNEKIFRALKPAFEAVFEAGKDSALTELNNQGGKIMDEKLLPCPFCGMKPEAIDVNTIYCSECDYDISMHQWNTRTYSQENGKQKTACIDFFEWWMSQPGEDIAQGYDEWRSEQST